MISTIPQKNISVNSESENASTNDNKEKTKLVTVEQAVVEKFMLALNETLEEISKFNEFTEQKINKHFSEIEKKQEQVEDFLSKQVANLEVLNNTTKALESQIKTAGSYSNYLEEKIKSEDRAKEISVLELSLTQERQLISQTLDKLSVEINQKLNQVDSRTSALKTADDILKQSVNSFSNNLQDVVEKRIKESDEKMFEDSKNAYANSEKTIKIITEKVEKILDNFTNSCQNNLEVMNKTYRNYLESTKEEQKRLIDKLPKEFKDKNKLDKKDILIVVSTVINFFIYIFIFFKMR